MRSHRNVSVNVNPKVTDHKGWHDVATHANGDPVISQMISVLTLLSCSLCGLIYTVGKCA